MGRNYLAVSTPYYTLPETFMNLLFITYLNHHICLGLFSLFCPWDLS